MADQLVFQGSVPQGQTVCNGHYDMDQLQRRFEAPHEPNHSELNINIADPPSNDNVLTACKGEVAFAYKNQDRGILQEALIFTSFNGFFVAADKVSRVLGVDGKDKEVRIFASSEYLRNCKKG